MPIIKSAKKRVRIAKKAAIRNTKTKRELRTAIKEFNAALVTGKAVAQAHSKAQSALDTAVKKGILHKNKAARKKRQLVSAAKSADKKVFVKSTKAAKPAPKKPTPAKKTAKKPTSKKKSTVPKKS